MKITREWAMPNAKTFSIPPIQKLIARHLTKGVWLDPFSRESPFWAECITNDLCPDFQADYHLEAKQFLQMFEADSVDGVLFDPPYSPRQISEVYKGVSRQVHTEDTQSSFYTHRKLEVARIIKPGGKVLCFGWNSQGVGKKLGFELIELLIVAHGGAHNDTLCTVEVKR